MITSIIISFVILLRVHLSQATSAAILFLNDTSQESSENMEWNGKKYIIKNEGCTIPYVSYSQNSIWDVYQYPVSLKPCPINQHPLIKNNGTHLWIIKENLRYYHAVNSSNFKCCYRKLTALSNDVRNESSSLGCVCFSDPLLIKHEFIEIVCSYRANIIYDEMFVFPVKKPFTHQRPSPFRSLDNQSEYNVVVLGLSSISRLNFHRTMKYTSNLVKEKEGIELFGYNIVAGNTFRNMMPAIVGMSTQELNRTCWPNARTTLDHCPYIWERFKDSGYYTVLAEDTTKSGIFKTKKFGFADKPTDYYLHPFLKENTLKSNRQESVCMGDEYYYNVALKLIHNLISILSPSKLFALLWESSISRKQLNFPNLLDKDYESFLRKLNDEGYLNETFVFVISDRGIKYGDIHLTKRSEFEQRLPIASILVPPTFSEKYPLAYENLKTNSRRLTTAFDIHETLIDLINLNAISNEEVLDRTRSHYTKQKGISLFLPIPGNRTCQSANIDLEWCSCARLKKAIVSNKRVFTNGQLTKNKPKHF